MKKRILVTGATSGIGRATALRLSEPGVEMIITGRRMDRLMALKSEVEARGAECLVLNFDVRSEQECIANLTPLGRVDILINNAGLAAGLEHIDRGGRLCVEARRAGHGAVYACRLPPCRPRGWRGAARHGRDRVLGGAFPWRQGACCGCL